MAIYEFVCNDCRLIWDKEASVKNAPKKSKCPKCSKLCEKNWESHAPETHFKGDFHTNVVKNRNFQRNGMDKDTAERFYDSAIKASKESIDKGWQAYSRYTPNIDNLNKNGANIRKLTDREVANKLDYSKKLTEAVYKEHNMDPTRPEKPQ